MKILVLQKHRREEKIEHTKQTEKKEIKKFIVNDNYISSNSHTDTENNQETSSTSENEQVFYIKTNQKITSSRVFNEKPSYTTQRTTSRVNVSTTSTSSDESESESSSDSSSIQYETPIKSKIREMEFRTPQVKSMKRNSQK